LQAAKPIAQVVANTSCVHRFILSLSWVRNKDRCTVRRRVRRQLSCAGHRLAKPENNRASNGKK